MPLSIHPADAQQIVNRFLEWLTKLSFMAEASRADSGSA